MSEANDKLTDSELYSEAGEHYRFFLSWRNATVVAIIAVAYFGLSFFSEQLDGPKVLSMLILFGMAIVVAILWISEIRTRDLYRTAQKVGEQLEVKAGKVGINKGYSKTSPRHQIWNTKKFNPEDLEPEKITTEWWKRAIYNGFSHSFAINTLCIIVLVGLLITAILRASDVIVAKEEPKTMDKQAEILELQKWNNEKMSQLNSKISFLETQESAVKTLEAKVDSLLETLKMKNRNDESKPMPNPKPNADGGN